MENQAVQNPTPEPTLTPIQVPAPKPKFPAMYLVLSLFILVLLASTVFLYYQNIQLKNMLTNYQTQPAVSPTPTTYQSPVPTTDPAANWKTYANTQYGFSLKYPENAKYELTHFTNSDFNIMFSNLTELPYEELVIYAGKSWAYTSPKADTTSNYTLDGTPAYREDLPAGQNPPQSIVYIKHGGYFFTIQQTKDTKDTAIDGVFNQILSTFKFTN